MNGYAYVTGNPVSLRDELGFAPVRRLDGGRTKKRSPQLSVPSHMGSRFPGARTTPAPAWHPPMSSPRAQSPAGTWPSSRRSASGTTPSTKVGRWSPPKPAATSPRTVSQPTARHTNDWWNPSSWDGDTWRTIGSVAAGIAVGVGVTAGILALGLCAGVTAGGCLVAAAVVAGGIGGAAGAATTYALSTDTPSAAGFGGAVRDGTFGGALTGGVLTGIGTLAQRTLTVKPVVPEAPAPGTAARTANGSAPVAAPPPSEWAQRIANGHAFDKHVLRENEFPGVATREEFASVVDGVMQNGLTRDLRYGRQAFWRDGVLVIRDPRSPDGGTAFRPNDGFAYYMSVE